MVELINTAFGGKDLRSKEKKQKTYEEMVKAEGLGNAGDSNQN